MSCEILYCKADYGDSSDTFYKNIDEDLLESTLKAIEENGCKIISVSQRDADKNKTKGGI